MAIASDLSPGVLTKLQREILKALRPYDSSSNNLHHYTELRDMLSVKVSNGELSSALKDLNDKDLVNYARYSNGIHFIYLTHRGKRYKEITRTVSRRVWIERVWIFLSGVVAGILVSRLSDIISMLATLITGAT